MRPWMIYSGLAAPAGGGNTGLKGIVAGNFFIYLSQIKLDHYVFTSESKLLRPILGSLFWKAQQYSLQHLQQDEVFKNRTVKM